MERLRRSENRMAGHAASDLPVRPVHASFLGWRWAVDLTSTVAIGKP